MNTDTDYTCTTGAVLHIAYSTPLQEPEERQKRLELWRDHVKMCEACQARERESLAAAQTQNDPEAQ